MVASAHGRRSRFVKNVVIISVGEVVLIQIGGAAAILASLWIWSFLIISLSGLALVSNDISIRKNLVSTFNFTLTCLSHPEFGAESRIILAGREILPLILMFFPLFIIICNIKFLGSSLCFISSRFHA